MKKLLVLMLIAVGVTVSGCSNAPDTGGGNDVAQNNQPAQPGEERRPSQPEPEPPVAQSEEGSIGIGETPGGDVPQEGTASFERVVQTAQQAFADRDYRTAMNELETALKIARENREKVIREFFPPAPEGFTREPAALPVFPGMAAQTVGVAPMMKYTGPGGEFRVTYTTDSDRLAMFIEKIMEAGGEGVEMTKVAGLDVKVEQKGEVTQLRMSIANQLMITILSQDFDKDFLLRVAETIDFGAVRRLI